MKKKHYILALLLVSTLMSLTSGTTNSNATDSQSTPLDTARVACFLDGERISAKLLYEKAMAGEVVSGTGERKSRAAILQYGEKYRYGIMFFETEKK